MSYSLYTLTDLTGRRATEHRTVITAGVDMSRRNFALLLVGAAIAVIVAALTWPVLGQYAALAGPIVGLAGVWFVGAQAKTGLQRRQYEALMDKRRSDVGKFFICGVEIDPEQFELGQLVASTVPAAGAPQTTGPEAGGRTPVTGTPPSGPVRIAPGPSPVVDTDALFGAGR